MTTSDSALPTTDEQPLGLRLRRARETAGLSVADAALQLKVPAGLVEAMEREDTARLGAAIYIRGHYSHYARLVGVPQVVVDSFCRRLQAEPKPLEATVRVSTFDRLFERYASRAVYVALTALIVVPVVWMSLSERVRMQPQALLDATPTADLAATAQDGGPVDAGKPADGPVRASMAPFYGVQPAPADAAAPATAAAAAPASVLEALPPPAPLAAAQDAVVPDAAPAPVADAGAAVVFRFREASWVEVLAKDGSRLAFGIIPAGEELRFPRTQLGAVALGNAGGVEVTLDGDSLDLTPYRRANVARFDVQSLGVAAPEGA